MLTVIKLILITLLCGPCILQCVVHFVSQRLSSLPQISVRRPRVQYIPMSDAPTES